MTTSKIEWTDRSDWNPIRGCTRVSKGCVNCYAEGMAARFSKPGQWGHGFAQMKAHQPRWTGKVELAEDRLTLPLRWKKPAKVFASSTSDIFHEALPDEAIDRIFAVMALCPHLTFQCLTKRPERMREYISQASRLDAVRAASGSLNWFIDSPGDLPHMPRWSMGWPLPNVWKGTSVENQEAADERIPHLLCTPAAVRFLSCEPLLGPIDLENLPSISGIGRYLDCLENFRDEHADAKGPVDWVICGGESGPSARPMHPDWARSLRDQCAEAGVAFHFKQWGEWAEAEESDTNAILLNVDPELDPNDCAYDALADVFMRRAGKSNTGRLLDGVEHNGMPG